MSANTSPSPRWYFLLLVASKWINGPSSLVLQRSPSSLRDLPRCVVQTLETTSSVATKAEWLLEQLHENNVDFFLEILSSRNPWKKIWNVSKFAFFSQDFVLIPGIVGTVLPTSSFQATSFFLLDSITIQWEQPLWYINSVALRPPWDSWKWGPSCCVTSHEFSPPKASWGFGKSPAISGNLGWWDIIIWPDLSKSSKSVIPWIHPESQQSARWFPCYFPGLFQWFLRPIRKDILGGSSPNDLPKKGETGRFLLGNLFFGGWDLPTW